MFFSEEQPKDYIKYETFKNCYHGTLDWKDIVEIGFDKVEEIVKSWEETYKQNEEIRKYNSNLFTEALKVVENFFKECDIDKYRYSSANPFKKLGTSKEWQMVYDKIQKKFKISCMHSKPAFNKITYNKKDITRFYQSYEGISCLNEAKRYFENLYKQDEAKANRFKTILKVAKENNIDLSDCSSEDGMYNVVNEFMKDKFIKENYPHGKEMYLKHGCDYCSTWVVGIHRCSCGNRRMSLIVDGDFIDGFYAYPEPY